MPRELMWVCAIVPEEFRKMVTQICLLENENIGLPENVFQLPLHISLKRSFHIRDYDSAKEDILKIMRRAGRFRCRIDKVDLHKKMIWLSLKNDGMLHYLHGELDHLLDVKYGVPISSYDRIFCPHISLFTRGKSEKILMMYNRLKEQDFGNEIEISKFVIGSSEHKDTFYTLE